MFRHLIESGTRHVGRQPWSSGAVAVVAPALLTLAAGAITLRPAPRGRARRAPLVISWPDEPLGHAPGSEDGMPLPAASVVEIPTLALSGLPSIPVGAGVDRIPALLSSFCNARSTSGRSRLGGISYTATDDTAEEHVPCSTT